MNLVCGSIATYNAGTHHANVQLLGEVIGLLSDIAVAANIDPALCVVGARVLLALPGSYNPFESVVVAVY